MQTTQSTHRRVVYYFLAVLVAITVLASPLGVATGAASGTITSAAASLHHSVLDAIADVAQPMVLDGWVKAYNPPDFVS